MRLARPLIPALVLALLAFLHGAFAAAQSGGDVADDAAIESAKEGLGPGWISERYPWYEPTADDFRPVDVSPSWYERLSEWLSELRGDVSWLFDWMWHKVTIFGRQFTVIELIGWSLLAAVIIFFIYLLVRWYRKSLQYDNVRVEHALGAALLDPTRIEALPMPARRHVSNLLGEARRLYQEGRFNEAIVYLFSHQLVTLDERQLIRLARGKTNRQYLREIGPRAAIKEIVRATMHVFEDAFFGNYTIERERFERCWTQLTDFDGLTKEGSAP